MMSDTIVLSQESRRPGASGGLQDSEANNESSEVVDILMPMTFYWDPRTRLDNVKKLLTIRY